MKKLAFVLFAGMLFVLGACSDDNNENEASNNDENNTDIEENQASDNAQNNEDNAINNEENTENNSGSNAENNADDNDNNAATNDLDEGEDVSDSELADFPEYDTLVDEIDVDTLEAEIETDNPNKRIILYADDSGEKVSKSIFIKKKDRLKIIDFDDDGEIFNDVIK